MIIASRHEVAFEIMCALNSTDITPVSELSVKTGRSNSAIEQVMSPLRRAGLVESLRGPGGGYRMTRPLTQINVNDLVKALDTSHINKRTTGFLAALMPQIQATPLSELADRQAASL
ncbi:RrF2 family transcriptional regulator [Leclercia adecarboxylata]|uniref:RrF2 family transcriptional regulator n=1 Tax=Leclercia adecarboxylata TaxID=83655 RepID=UPI0011180122|nr:Rrf2 family transcriptional regulator [Leclercia adecarboxylata]QCZ30197.1 Rrf2 family transcriptional regulator [Leclercia adecarboxylata]